MRSKLKLTAAGGLVTAALGATLTVWTLANAATALPSGNENTSILVQNVGTAPADFVVDYYLPNGTILNASENQDDVPVGGTRNFQQAINSDLGAGYRGVGVVSSDQPINALLVRDILNSQATNSHSYSIVNAQASGGPALALPILLDEFSSDQYNSRASVVNTGTETACLRVTYYVTATLGATPVGQSVVDSPTGQAGCAGGGYSLPAGGQITFGRAGTGTVQFPNATRSTQMAALIEVLNANANNTIAASADLYRSDGNRLLGSYNGFIVNTGAPATDDVGTDVVIPLALKHSSGFYSVIGVMNLGNPADIQIRYLGATEGGTPVDVTVNLPNVQKAGFHSTYDTSTNIPLDFVGYARVTSSQPVAGLLVRGKQTTYLSGINEPIYTAANGVPTDQADTFWNLPLIFRRFAQTFAGSIGYNSWIQVQVADGSSAQVTLRFVGDPTQGCPVGPFETTRTVNGSFVFYMNANSDNGFPANNQPNCFFGGAQVSGNKPLIVIANVSSDSYPGGDNEGLYNAFASVN